MNLKNKIASTSGLSTEYEDEQHKKQEQSSAFSTLYHPSYNHQSYLQSPHRYGGSNQFYNTVHTNTSFSNPGEGKTLSSGVSSSTNPYAIKTASVYPNNLYNNITSVGLPGSSSDPGGMSGKLSSMYDPQLERGDNVYITGGAANSVALRKPPGLDRQIPTTSSRGSPLSNSRNLNHASRRQAIYLPPNSRQLYEEIAIVGSAGSSSGRSSVSRQQSPLEPNFLQSSGSKHTSRGNSSEVDILESPSRYSPAPLVSNSSQQHSSQQQHQAKSSMADHYSSKPPLPPESSFASNQSKDSSGSNGGGNSNGPRPPPRTRPKSWTSSLFNRALRNNHRSVTFQRVEEEASQQNQQHNNETMKQGNKDQMIIADERAATGIESNYTSNNTATNVSKNGGGAPKDGLMQAKQQMLFYSLPRSKQQVKSRNGNLNNGSEKTGTSNSATSPIKSNTRSRTPSPFRTIMKNLVKGMQGITRESV